MTCVADRVVICDAFQEPPAAEIFQVEDEITEKRDGLIDQLEKRLAQRTVTETLFTLRWAVV